MTDILDASELGSVLGAGATIVQFSSTFCQPCRMTRLVVERAVDTARDVAYVDLDVAEHLDDELSVSKLSSAKGFRVLEVTRAG